MIIPAIESYPEIGSTETGIGAWYNPADWGIDLLKKEWLGIPAWIWLAGGAILAYLLLSGEEKKPVPVASQSPIQIRIGDTQVAKRRVRRGHR